MTDPKYCYIPMLFHEVIFLVNQNSKNLTVKTIFKIKFSVQNSKNNKLKIDVKQSQLARLLNIDLIDTQRQPSKAIKKKIDFQLK